MAVGSPGPGQVAVAAGRVAESSSSARGSRTEEDHETTKKIAEVRLFPAA